MEITTASLNDPRRNAIEAMRASVPRQRWEINANWTDSLRRTVKAHAICRHPIITELKTGRFSIEVVRRIHLEYRHAIVQIFTDALLMAQVQARQIEPRLPPGSKMAPRFLLTLNILDEFGFAAGSNSSGYYRGSPAFAHYPLFENVLNNLGITMEMRKNFCPSECAINLHEYLKHSFYNYTAILALLAAAEEQVIIFSPALRLATSHTGVDVSEGYYHVHGTSGDEDTNAHDDDHEADLWAALNQACVDEDHAPLEASVLNYLDLWYRFWTLQQTESAEEVQSRLPLPAQYETSSFDIPLDYLANQQHP